MRHQPPLHRLASRPTHALQMRQLLARSRRRSSSALLAQFLGGRFPRRIRGEEPLSTLSEVGEGVARLAVSPGVSASSSFRRSMCRHRRPRGRPSRESPAASSRRSLPPRRGRIRPLCEYCVFLLRCRFWFRGSSPVHSSVRCRHAVVFGHLHAESISRTTRQSLLVFDRALERVEHAAALS